MINEEWRVPSTGMRAETSSWTDLRDSCPSWSVHASAVEWDSLLDTVVATVSASDPTDANHLRSFVLPDEEPPVAYLPDPLPEREHPTFPGERTPS